MAEWNAFSASKTEVPWQVIPTYIAQINKSILDLENDLLVTEKQLQAAKAALKALEAI